MAFTEQGVAVFATAWTRTGRRIKIQGKEKNWI